VGITNGQSHDSRPPFFYDLNTRKAHPVQFFLFRITPRVEDNSVDPPCTSFGRMLGVDLIGRFEKSTICAVFASLLVRFPPRGSWEFTRFRMALVETG